MNVTDDRQTTDGRATSYSERELTFTFAKNDELTDMYFKQITHIQDLLFALFYLVAFI